ncbi:MAG: hypothetical protein HRU26_13380 [Psychroserpens sp.]|nr:hypothetical protein [Psychroserpens sp.]
MIKTKSIVLILSLIFYSCTQEKKKNFEINDTSKNSNAIQENDLNNDSIRGIKNVSDSINNMYTQSVLKSEIFSNSELAISEYFSPKVSSSRSEKSMVLYCEWKSGILQTRELYIGISDISNIELGKSYKIPNNLLTFTASQSFNNPYPFLHMRGHIMFKKIDTDASIIDIMLVGDLSQNDNRTRFDTIVYANLIVIKDFKRNRASPVSLE